MISVIVWDVKRRYSEVFRRRHQCLWYGVFEPERGKDIDETIINIVF